MAIAILLFVAAAWTIFSGVVTRNLLFIEHLPDSAALDPAPSNPRVSVVIAARNEAGRIGETVQRLLAQQGVELEVIVVDDRSEDDTPRILADIAGRDPRLRVIRIEALPPNWLGKCHACYRGAGQATGDWILFSDADVHMRNDVVRRAVATAERDGAHLLGLWPAVNSRGLLTQAAVLGWAQFLIAYAPLAAINRDRGRRALGIGAFNLIRADTYRAVGGYETLRMDVVDDLKLAMLVRRAGHRQRVYWGLNDIEAEWAGSLPEFVRLLEKNWFAGVRFNLLFGVAVIVASVAFWTIALTGPLIDVRWGWLPALGLATTMAPAVMLCRASRWPSASAVLAPLMIVVFPVAGVRSIYKALRQGGIRWRDTFYSLGELRAGIVYWRD